MKKLKLNPDINNQPRKQIDLLILYNKTSKHIILRLKILSIFNQLLLIKLNSAFQPILRQHDSKAL
jgi:hypothetical protein